MFNFCNTIFYQNALISLVYKPIKRVVLLWYNGWHFYCVEIVNRGEDVSVILISLLFSLCVFVQII